MVSIADFKALLANLSSEKHHRLRERSLYQHSWKYSVGWNHPRSRPPYTSTDHHSSAAAVRVGWWCNGGGGGGGGAGGGGRGVSGLDFMSTERLPH